MRRAILFLGLALTLSACGGHAPPAYDESAPLAQVERGRYLAVAGDCEACHTSAQGAPYAGGRPVETPFGTFYSANITPDRTNGIGGWSPDQFYRALHEGIGPDGTHLYPAFPYPWYTKVAREDSDAIHAYLRSLSPVSEKPPEHRLMFPLNFRFVMTGWNALFFKPGAFAPDAGKSPEWNRGAYLVEGLGHCGACHTPTNLLGAARTSMQYQGGVLENWLAPSLVGDLRAGLGGWSAGEVVEFLKTGRNDKTLAYGLMSEVIAKSTSKLSDADLQAMADYLKDLPAPPATTPASAEPRVAAAGEALYVDDCAACHRGDGQGVAAMFPALKGDSMVQSADPTTVLRLILNGGQAVATDARPTPFAMPAFGWKLSDDETAAVATYVRNAWGNAAAPVDAAQVRRLREKVTATAR
jgi:mono/diheme cytochrome c family protein